MAVQEPGLLSAFPMYMTISAFTAVAWAFAFELNIAIYFTFKRKRGLYFWSLILSSWGCILHGLGFLLKFFYPSTNVYLVNTIVAVGWWSMVTGQAVVLYSRLHLVLKNGRILKFILGMIIWNAITLHIPTSVLTYGSSSTASAAFLPGFTVMEKIQMTIFCLQEFSISTIYVWATLKLLKPVYRRRTRNVMVQLIWINGLIIGMDVVLLAMEYSGYYQIEATLKPMVYAIKLKLEFVVLNQLMRLSNSTQNAALMSDELPGPSTRQQPRSRPLALISRILPNRHAFHDESTSFRSVSLSGGSLIGGKQRRFTALDSPPIKINPFTATRKNSGSNSPPENAIAVATDFSTRKSPAPQDAAGADAALTLLLAAQAPKPTEGTSTKCNGLRAPAPHSAHRDPFRNDELISPLDSAESASNESSAGGAGAEYFWPATTNFRAVDFGRRRASEGERERESRAAPHVPHLKVRHSGVPRGGREPREGRESRHEGGWSGQSGESTESGSSREESRSSGEIRLDPYLSTTSQQRGRQFGLDAEKIAVKSDQRWVSQTFV